MKNPRLAFTALIFAATSIMGASDGRAAETGDLKIHFKYGGAAPDAKAIIPTANAEFCGKNPLSDPSLMVDKDNQGLKNVVVYVYTGRGGSDIDFEGGEAEVKELANRGCEFDPHIVITKTGDTLKVTNPDPIGHNANIQFFKNKAVNPTIPAGQFVDVELVKPEPAPIPIACNIHPWMTAFVVVLDHPYAAVSDKDGNLVIKGLPVGKELVFRAYHESARIKEVEIDGKKTKWKRSRFEVKIEPGMNDLGTVVIGEDQFQ